MGKSGSGSDRPKADLPALLALHRQLNPVRGELILVALDQATGQLFLCAPKGSCIARDQAARQHQ